MDSRRFMRQSARIFCRPPRSPRFRCPDRQCLQEPAREKCFGSDHRHSLLLVTPDNYGYMGPIKAALDSCTRFLVNSSADSEVRFNVVGAGPLKTSASAGIPGYLESYLYAEKLTFRKRNLSTQEIADTAGCERAQQRHQWHNALSSMPVWGTISSTRKSSALRCAWSPRAMKFSSSHRVARRRAAGRSPHVGRHRRGTSAALRAIEASLRPAGVHDRDSRAVVCAVRDMSLRCQRDEAVLAKSGLRAEQVELFIHAAVSRDMLKPATASSAHRLIGLPPTAQIFDVSNACLGFLNSLTVAACDDRERTDPMRAGRCQQYVT